MDITNILMASQAQKSGGHGGLLGGLGSLFGKK